MVVLARLWAGQARAKYMLGAFRPAIQCCLLALAAFARARVNTAMLQSTLQLLGDAYMAAGALHAAIRVFTALSRCPSANADCLHSLAHHRLAAAHFELARSLSSSNMMRASTEALEASICASYRLLLQLSADGRWRGLSNVDLLRLVRDSPVDVLDGDSEYAPLPAPRSSRGSELDLAPLQDSVVRRQLANAYVAMREAAPSAFGAPAALISIGDERMAMEVLTIRKDVLHDWICSLHAGNLEKLHASAFSPPSVQTLAYLRERFHARGDDARTVLACEAPARALQLLRKCYNDIVVTSRDCSSCPSSTLYHVLCDMASILHYEAVSIHRALGGTGVYFKEKMADARSCFAQLHAYCKFLRQYALYIFSAAGSYAEQLLRAWNGAGVSETNVACAVAMLDVVRRATRSSPAAHQIPQVNLAAILLLAGQVDVAEQFARRARSGEVLEHGVLFVHALAREAQMTAAADAATRGEGGAAAPRPVHPTLSPAHSKAAHVAPAAARHQAWLMDVASLFTEGLGMGLHSSFLVPFSLYQSKYQLMRSWLGSAGPLARCVAMEAELRAASLCRMLHSTDQGNPIAFLASARTAFSQAQAFTLAHGLLFTPFQLAVSDAAVLYVIEALLLRAPPAPVAGTHDGLLHQHLLMPQRMGGRQLARMWRRVHHACEQALNVIHPSSWSSAQSVRLELMVYGSVAGLAAATFATQAGTVPVPDVLSMSTAMLSRAILATDLQPGNEKLQAVRIEEVHARVLERMSSSALPAPLLLRVYGVLLYAYGHVTQAAEVLREVQAVADRRNDQNTAATMSHLLQRMQARDGILRDSLPELQAQFMSASQRGAGMHELLTRWSLLCSAGHQPSWTLDDNQPSLAGFAEDSYDAALVFVSQTSEPQYVCGSMMAALSQRSCNLSAMLAFLHQVCISFCRMHRLDLLKEEFNDVAEFVRDLTQDVKEAIAKRTLCQQAEACGRTGISHTPQTWTPHATDDLLLKTSYGVYHVQVMLGVLTRLTEACCDVDVNEMAAYMTSDVGMHVATPELM